MLDPTSPIGIVAGGGGVVPELLQSLNRNNQPYKVAAIFNETDFDVSNDNTRVFKWGEIGKIINYFKDNNCERLILLGHIRQRPDFRSIIGDPGTLIRVPKLVKALKGGDDSVLRNIIKLIETENFRVIGLQDAAPDLLCPSGLVGKHTFSKDLDDDLVRAKSALRELGKHDIGQALVMIGGRIVAVEGAEGTDNMLQRIVELRGSGRLSEKAARGFLLKGAKLGQDLRVDLPTVGPQTVRMASKAGLSGIVVEADKVILLHKSQTRDILDREGLFLIGDGEF